MPHFFILPSLSSSLGMVMLCLWSVLSMLGPVVVFASRSCVKTVSGRYQVNLSRLDSSRVTLSIRDAMNNDINYIAAVCGDRSIAKPECKVDDVVAVIENSCQYLGRFSSEGPFELLDSQNPQRGVRVTYGNGAECPYLPGSQYSAIFNFECDPNAKEPYTALVSAKDPKTVKQGPCRYEFNFKTASACPVAISDSTPSGSSGEGGGWTFLILFFLMTCYCIGGSIYKANKYGASGAEVIPHIDFFRKGLIQVKNCLKTPVDYLFPPQNNQYSKHNPQGHFGADDVEVLEFSTNRNVSHASLMHDDFEEDVKL